jgi:hypothetical protein
MEASSDLDDSVSLNVSSVYWNLSVDVHVPRLAFRNLLDDLGEHTIGENDFLFFVGLIPAAKEFGKTIHGVELFEAWSDLVDGGSTDCSLPYVKESYSQFRALSARFNRWIGLKKNTFILNYEARVLDEGVDGNTVAYVFFFPFVHFSQFIHV